MKIRRVETDITDLQKGNDPAGLPAKPEEKISADCQHIPCYGIEKQ